MNFFKKLPLPLAGTLLGCAALGNLLNNPAPAAPSIWYKIFGIVAALLWILLLVKLIFVPKETLSDLKNPVIASVAPTFSMATIVLSPYILATGVAALKPIAFAFWLIGIVLHLVLLVLYTVRFLLKFNMRQLFPSTFIVYVGIVVVSMTAPAFAKAGYAPLARPLGIGAFWFGLITLILLLLPLLYRSLIVREFPPPALPTLAIFAAPIALCTAGYLNLTAATALAPIPALIWILFIGALIAYAAIIITLLVKLLWLPFSPGYSSYTFPLVISAIALKGLARGPLKSVDWLSGMFSALIPVMTWIAALVVLYVLVRYIIFMLAPTPQAPAQ